MKHYLFQSSLQLVVIFVFYASIAYKRIRCGLDGSVKKNNKNSRSILVVSFYSPPYKSSYGTQRTSKFIKYLSRMGWDITLLTTYPFSEQEQDLSGENLPDNVEVIRIRPLFAWALKDPVPDRFMSWIVPATISALKTVKRKKISLVYATAPPYSNLMAATICSNLMSTPLVVDFRDPWNRIDEPYWMVKSNIAKMVNRRLEEAVLRCASKVLMVVRAEDADDYFVTTQNGIKRKIISIPNGFDEEDFAGTNLPELEQYADKFILSYVGIVYDDETAISIFGPLKEWYNLHPDDFSRIVFVHAGPRSHYVEKYAFDNLAVADFGFISHADSIALRFASDLQFFSLPSMFKPHVLSGKIFEMIRVGVPIVALANPEGAAARLILDSGTGFVVQPGDHRGTAVLLKKLFDEWRTHGRITVTAKEDVIRSYSREAQARQLGQVLEAMVA